MNHREWIEAYADRIAAMDREAFRRSTWIDVPRNLVWPVSRRERSSAWHSSRAPFSRGRQSNGLMILTGTGVLLAATHDLAGLMSARRYENDGRTSR